MSTVDKPRLLILVGPTAVGKTAFSIACAKRFNGEILSADSMQIYRGMDIGTAKVTPEEMQGVPHYGIDLVDPDQPFTVAEFQTYADEVIRDIHARGKLPIVAGGTMFYVKSLTDHLDFTEVSGDPDYRRELQILADEQGGEVLHKQLQRIDPITAAKLHPNDVKRVIRGLEVFHNTGKPMSESYQAEPDEPKYRFRMAGLNLDDRQVLYERINRRVDIMMEQGLVDEVRGLLERGYSRDLQSMQAIGYKEIVDALEGRLTLEEAVEAVKQGSRRYAKRQLSWWRREDRIHWFDVSQTTEEERLSKIASQLEGIS